MSNPTTAAEWKQVAANAQAQIVAVNQQKAQGEEQINALEQQLLANGQQISDYLNANPRITSRDPGLLALQSQTDTIKQNLAKTEVYVRATLTSQLFQLRATINNANTQAGVASTGAPNTNENTPPETVVPNQSNTAVTTETPPPVQNFAPPTEPVIPAFPQRLATPPIFIQPQVQADDTPPSSTFTPPPIDNSPIVQVTASETTTEKIQNPTPVNVDPNTNVGFGTDPNPGIVTPGTGPDPVANVNIMGVQAPKNEAVAQQTTQDANNANTQGDWRVRLSLAPNSTYLYNAKPAGILAYLKDTNGVVFPYVPQIQVTYAANYETADIVHNNYKMIQYKNSAVDQITITGDFTAQDTYEANYLLAVIHFFRSVTKMFYGKDQIPKPGTPPPLCYLSGLGDFQFDYHPLVISSFNYSLPNDVDYIRASSPTLGSGVDSTAYNAKSGTAPITETRLGVLNTGATASPPNFGNFKATNTQPTYVPTKMSISITAFPMVTRNDISNRFSVKDYATGKLLQGRKNPGGGGIW